MVHNSTHPWPEHGPNASEPIRHIADPTLTYALVYTALLIGCPLVVSSAFGKWGVRRYWSYMIGFGLLTTTMLYLNCQFAPWNDPKRVWLFVVGLFDVPFSLFFPRNPGKLSRMPMMMPCDQPTDMPLDIACSPWQGQANLGYHMGFVVEFYNQYIFGKNAVTDRIKLTFHIFGQSLSLALCYLQFHKPTRKKYPVLHRWSGRVAVTAGTIGALFGGWLGTVHFHDDVASYGGWFNALGVMWCSVLTCTCLFMGVRAARNKDFASHKKWMMRYGGAMWGIFLVFRLIFLVVGPILVWWKVGPGVIYCLCSWVSGPIGILMADYVHNKNLREEQAQTKLEAAMQEGDDESGAGHKMIATAAGTKGSVNGGGYHEPNTYEGDDDALLLTA